MWEKTKLFEFMVLEHPPALVRLKIHVVLSNKKPGPFRLVTGNRSKKEREPNATREKGQNRDGSDCPASGPATCEVQAPLW